MLLSKLFTPQWSLGCSSSRCNLWGGNTISMGDEDSLCTGRHHRIAMPYRFPFSPQTSQLMTADHDDRGHEARHNDISITQLRHSDIASAGSSRPAPYSQSSSTACDETLADLCPAKETVFRVNST